MEIILYKVLGLGFNTTPPPPPLKISRNISDVDFKLGRMMEQLHINILAQNM